MRFLRLAVVVYLLGFVAQPASAVSYNLSGGVEQLNSKSGEPTYDFHLSLTEWLGFHDNISLELVSPNGVRFPEVSAATNWVFASIKGILPADINSTVSGVWTVEETIDGTQLNQYQFSVPSVLNSSNFHAVPVITSPLDGATVGPVFDVTWTNSLPGGVGYRMSATNASISPNITINAPGHATFSYLGDSGFSGIEVYSFSIYQDPIFTNALLPVTPLSPNATSNFASSGLSGKFSYRTLSPPISFTVVPEANTIAYLLMAVVTALCLARRT